MRIQFHGLSNYHAEDHRDLSRTVVPGHINSNITDMSGTKNKPTIQRGWIDQPIPKTPQIQQLGPCIASWIKGPCSHEECRPSDRGRTAKIGWTAEPETENSPF